MEGQIALLAWNHDHWAHDVCPGTGWRHHKHCQGSNDSLQNMQRFLLIEFQSWKKFNWLTILENQFNQSVEFCSNIEEHTNESIYTDIEKEVSEYAAI